MLFFISRWAAEVSNGAEIVFSFTQLFTAKSPSVCASFGKDTSSRLGQFMIRTLSVEPE
jgi:hypothetical protein